MNILVTGASGFIGLNLLERLLSQGHHVIALSLDLLPDVAQCEFEKLPGSMETLQIDVRDEAALREVLGSRKVDAIFAGAAVTPSASHERISAGEVFDVNLSAVVKLITLAAGHGVRRLVALSSTAAMGERMFSANQIVEDDAPQPAALYGIAKAALESVARRWAVLSPDAPQVVVGRLSAVFGPWERASGMRDSLSPMHAIAAAAIRGTPIAPLPRGGRRDWVHAAFVASVLEWMLTTQRPNHSLYNIGAGITWHPREFVGALAATGLKVVEEPGAAEISFNDDLSRERTYLHVGRLSAEFAAPPTPHKAARSHAEWAAAHADWFRA
jgi:nucleoside-diphosphate-sugar epimerase